MASHGDARKGIIIITIVLIINMITIMMNNHSPRLELAMVEMERSVCPGKWAG